MAMESQSGQFSLVAFCPQRVFAVDNRAGGNIFTQAKNMLTQRTIGPVCTGSVSMDVSGMKEGDFADCLFSSVNMVRWVLRLLMERNIL